MMLNKPATVQSTAVTKTYSSLISCSTFHELSVLHAWECDAMIWNVVKRLANQNRVNCLFDEICLSDTLSFFTEQRKKYVLRAQRTVSGTKKQDESFVASLLSEQWAQPEGIINASYWRFTESKLRNDSTGAVLRLDPGLQSAASFMGLGVSGSHWSKSIKFHLRHSGLSSAVWELPFHPCLY